MFDELRKACETATRGPWFSVLFGGSWSIVLSNDYSGIDVLEGDNADPDNDPLKDECMGVGDQEAEANGKFIAMCRTEVPKLLAAFDALHKALYKIGNYDYDGPTMRYTAREALAAILGTKGEK